MMSLDIKQEQYQISQLGYQLILCLELEGIFFHIMQSDTKKSHSNSNYFSLKILYQHYYHFTIYMLVRIVTTVKMSPAV